MKASFKKKKGNRLERQIAEMYRAYGIDKDAERMPASGALSHNKEDILHKSIRVADECKNQETWRVIEWYKEAKEKVGDNIPVFLHLSRNREEIYTFLRTSDFFDILKCAMVGGYFGRQVLAKPQRGKRLSMEEIKDLPLSKEKQIMKRKK